ncbi:TetR/AcrR family transcriptional regulator [Brevibacillus panacihumi]|uniref:TetR/AcrR family transcriptional regulator n=1 Tax=Brevibacillus panacihumi TaxID=497735 RepID=UPI003D02F89F
MSTSQGKKAEETRRNILSAAEELFMTRGYDAVTMREIAKKAGCSHTAIYIYFREKEALLLELSLPILNALTKQLDDIMKQIGLPHEKLTALSLALIRFGLTHRNMYPFIFTVKSSPVDEATKPLLDIKHVRQEIFAKFKQAIHDSLPFVENDERLLTNVHILFYTLHGIIVTHSSPAESTLERIDQLAPSFREACEVLISGFRSRAIQTE